MTIELETCDHMCLLIMVSMLSVWNVISIRFCGAMVQFHSSLTVNIHIYCRVYIIQSRLVVYMGFGTCLTLTTQHACVGCSNGNCYFQFTIVLVQWRMNVY